MLSYQLFKDDRGSNRTIVVPRIEDERDELEGIRCPLCAWRPTRHSEWSCIGAHSPEGGFAGCGTVWNTFLTRGRCPGCSHQWRWTSCLRCAAWSLHDDWYERTPTT